MGYIYSGVYSPLICNLVSQVCKLSRFLHWKSPILLITFYKFRCRFWRKLVLKGWKMLLNICQGRVCHILGQNLLEVRWFSFICDIELFFFFSWSVRWIYLYFFSLCFEKKNKQDLRTSPDRPSKTVILIFFLGGVTYAEIAALRLLGKQQGILKCFYLLKLNLDRKSTKYIDKGRRCCWTGAFDDF